ncbi:hypothetical protein J4Q44_G00015310 [Coregonus suidteri]|uniref:Uncharacterized protein n=1 Tax=Coregonus suidteri TaxID=861788 RepID=A0AAN8R9W1_9TELE
MSPHKFVVKCGSYAVLVDLQIMGPLGHRATQETRWFTAEHTEEVTSLVRDAVDRRVRLYIDCLHKRGQPKHKRELPQDNPLCMKGRRVSLVANFVKRHFNLRCIVKQRYGELRVFPERYVVCVSRLEDASANPTPAVTVTVSQSTESQYFSRPAAETRDELNSSTMTKRSSLQKIARHANARPQPETQPLPCGSILGRKLHSEQSSDPQPLTGQPSLTTEAVLLHGHPTTSTDPTVRVGAVGGVGPTEGQQASVLGLPGNTHPSGTVLSQGHHHDAPAPGRTQSQTSQTTVKVELLTPGKQSQSLLPLTSSNNTEQTNQNSPAASLRGRSVKDVVSSAWSIASTYTDAMGEREEERENRGMGRRGEEKRGREGRGREVKRGKIMEGRERKRGDEGKDNGGKESRRGEERRSEERENVARPSRLRRLKK